MLSQLEEKIRRNQQIESGSILNIINFDFNEKEYEFKYSDLECTVSEIYKNNKDNVFTYLKIYESTYWEKNNFITTTDDEKLGNFCDEIYDYCHKH